MDMDIYGFLNSPDVAEHCRNLNHKFNIIESAVIIKNSDSHKLSDKHKAYKTLLTRYPDMEANGFLLGHIRSFHEELQNYIAFEERLIDILLTSETGAFYKTSVSEYNEYFSSYTKAIVDMKDHIEKMDVEEISDYEYRIEKIYLDSHKSICVNMSPSGDILSCFNTGFDENVDWRPPNSITNKAALALARSLDSACKENNYRLSKPNLLESFYIEIPIPFKRGGLLERTYRCNGQEGNIYVLKDPYRYSPEMHAKLLNGDGDASDMLVDVFCYTDCRGVVYCDDVFYPNLRYCHHELMGETRILKYVSQYLKDKICLCDLLTLQRYLPLKEITNKHAGDYELNYTLNRIDDKLFKDEYK